MPALHGKQVAVVHMPVRGHVVDKLVGADARLRVDAVDRELARAEIHEIFKVSEVVAELSEPEVAVAAGLAAISHCFSVGSETSIPAFSESHLQKSRASFHDTRTTLCSGRLEG